MIRGKKAILKRVLRRALWLGAVTASVSLAGIRQGGAQAPPSFVPGRVLVKFAPQVGAARAHGLIAAAGARDSGEIAQIGVHIIELPPVANEAAFAHAFKGQADVEFAEPDYVLPPDSTPNDPYYGKEWHLPKIAAPTAWNSTTGATSLIIAVLDTGVDGTHPDLASKMLAGWNTYDNNSDTRDVYGHGTAVAGTATALSNNGNGIASVAWGCRLMPVRISDTNGYGYSSAIAAGLIWAADHGARVANISYRIDYSSSVTSAAQYFMSKGGVVTMSAGNESTFHTEGDNPYILVVSATDSSDSMTSWSNTGNNVDLAAPGISIYTTTRGGGYGSWWGTSFSAPIVAGIAALVLSANPALSAQDVQDIFKESADDLGTAGWDTDYGWGRVNAARAVSLAAGAGATPDTTPPTVAFASPLAGSAVSGTVTVQANAGDNLGVASVTLYLNGVAVATDTAAPFTLLWDTRTTANGTYTWKAVAADTSGNTAAAQINVTVNNAADTVAPSVLITSPVNGAKVSRTVSVKVNASDNVGVTRVELYVDGKLISTSAAAPFTTSWNSRKASSGAHTLVCKAYDAAGNSRVSPAITVYR